MKYGVPVKILPGFYHATGTRIDIDGHEMREVTDIKVHFPVDGPARVDVKLLPCMEPIEIANADVYVHIHVPEGFVLEVTAEGNVRKYRCRR